MALAAVSEMLGPMLRAVLEDRFQLKIHTEPRETSVYLMTLLEKNKLQPAKDGACVPMDLFQMQAPPSSSVTYCGGGKTVYAGEVAKLDSLGITMAELAGRILSSLAGRPVVDRTGLSGRFDVHLEFAPQRPQGTVMLNGQLVELPPSPQSADSSPTIFTALEKVGLKLSSGKAPVDVLVIDRIEKPSEN